MKKLYRMATLVGALCATSSMFAMTPTETLRTDFDNEIRSCDINRPASAAAQSETRAGDGLNRNYSVYTWVDKGIAQYRENIITSIMTLSGYNYQYYDVPVQEAKEVPGLYRLVNPYGEYFPAAQYVEGSPDLSNYDPTVTEYLYLHCENQDADGVSTLVWMDQLDSQFHSTQTKLGNYHMSSQALNYYLDLGFTLYEAQSVGKTGTYKQGVITFPQNSLMVKLDGYQVKDGEASWLAANVDGLFSVILPAGIDYGIGCAPSAVCAKDNKISVDITRHPDINVKYGLFEGRISIQDIDPYAIALETQGTLLPQGESTVSLTVPNGIHTFIAISIDENGEAQKGTLCLLYGIEDNMNHWDSLGTTTWREDFLTTFYSYLDATTMECELQIRKDGKMLRLVNPYQNHPMREALSTHPTDHNHYLNFIINEDDRCEMPYSTVDFGNEGVAMIVGDYVGYWRDNTGYDDDRIAEDGLFGWLSKEEDGTWLRFDWTCLTARMGDDGSIWRVCNETQKFGNDGEFGILLPMDKINNYTSGIDAVVGETQAPVEYFNLQGQRIDNPEAGSIVIKRQGSKVSKQIVR